MGHELCDYALLFARERDAWARLMASKVDGHYDPRLMSDWVETSRRCATRSDATDPAGQDQNVERHRWDYSHHHPGAILSPGGSAVGHDPDAGPRTPPAASAHTHESQKMNKDQAQGIAKDIAGKVQETAGQVTGNREQEAKGILKQVEGKTQETLGDAKEIVKDATK
ncbi:CsbD family protein [Caenimonas sedimenti]